MSSTYRILCLSHDPAADTHAAFATDTGVRDALRHGTVEGHGACVLAAAHYDGHALVSIGHYADGAVRWTGVDHLRLLAYALLAPQGSPVRICAAGVRPVWWTEERLRRLHGRLGVLAGDGSDGDAPPWTAPRPGGDQLRAARLLLTAVPGGTSTPSDVDAMHTCAAYVIAADVAAR